MEKTRVEYNFDSEVLKAMDEFEKDFLRNGFKKDTSENKGPNYKNIAKDDAVAFEEFLESDFSKEFLQLS